MTDAILMIVIAGLIVAMCFYRWRARHWKRLFKDKTKAELMNGFGQTLGRAMGHGLGGSMFNHYLDQKEKIEWPDEISEN